MANEQIINILLKLKGEIDQSVKQLKGSIEGVEKASNKTEKSLIQTFRGGIQPVRMFFRTISMYAFVFTATVGTMIKAVLDFGKAIDSLDKTSASLGMTTEELSKKIYGFNMATREARTGNLIIQNILQETKNLWEKLGFAIATATNEYALYQKRVEMDAQKKNINWLGKAVEFTKLMLPFGSLLPRGGVNTTREEAQEALTGEQQARRANTEEAYQIEADLRSQILKLQNKEVEALAVSLEAQRRLYVNTFNESSDIVQTYDLFVKLQIEKQKLAYYGLKTATQNIQDTWKSAVNNMRSMFSDVFYNFFTGQLNSMQDAFTQFGQGILRTFSNMISEMITQWMVMRIITGIGSLFGGASSTTAGSSVGFRASGAQGVASQFGRGLYHTGGIVRAHHGLAIDEVPIIAQRGERVLSRAQNKEYEQGMSKQPVYVFIQAWDTTDIMRNRKSIEGIISNAIITRSPLRGVIKNG
jgi:hypothetical protein